MSVVTALGFVLAWLVAVNLLGLRRADWLALCPDLKKERLMRFLDTPLVMPAIFAVQLLLAWTVAAALTGHGALGSLWLWTVHVFLTNTSWPVNSICHWPAFGVQPWPVGDGSRDVPWMSVFTNGESDHNSHHRYPRSARYALDGGHDLSWRIIQLLGRMGIASDPWLPRKYCR